ncbi:MAG: ABC transporter permease, partial [Longimicrobiales bacterium]|nr:ABC transporter permease [Longimicrobiales bacterium]
MKLLPTILRREPWLALGVVSTLGVAIGAVVALFAVFQAVLLDPLPYPDSERIVRLWETNTQVDGDLHGPSPLNVVDWRRSATTTEAMAAWFLTSVTYRGRFGVQELRTARVTHDFRDVLGVDPTLGRWPAPGEVADLGPVLLSDGLFQEVFGGDTTLVGETIELGGRSHRVAGVMPPGFAFPDGSVDIWMTWSLEATYAARPETRTWRFLGAVARTAPDAALRAAQEELDVIAASLAEAYPIENAGWGVRLVPLREDVVGETRGPLRVGMAAVAFILLIACANVANLLLARAPARVDELATRQALGATRGRLFRDLLLEHLTLSILAGALGVWLSSVLLDLVLAWEPGIPRLEQAAVDGSVVAFALTLTVATGLAFGLAPTLHALGRGGAEALRLGSRSHRPGTVRAREIFVGSQVAITVALVLGAGLFSTSFSRIVGQDPGLDTNGVLTFRVALDPSDAGPGGAVVYYEELLRRLREVPGVEAAGAAQTLPLQTVGNDFFRPYRPVGSQISSGEAPTVQMRIVTAGYAGAVGMTLLEGGGIPETLAEGEPMVAVVNQTLARRLWPDGDAVGASFEVDFREGWLPYTVVGVVADVRHYGLREPPRPEVFLAHAQAPYLAMSVAVRGSGRPETLVDPITEVVLSQAPTQPPYDFVTLDELARASVADDRFLAMLLRLAAGIALLLAASGVYGVVSYTVGHRRREIGVRMALGADSGTVVREILRGSVTVTLLGLAAGLV